MTTVINILIMTIRLSRYLRYNLFIIFFIRLCFGFSTYLFFISLLLCWFFILFYIILFDISFFFFCCFIRFFIIYIGISSCNLNYSGFFFFLDLISDLLEPFILLLLSFLIISLIHQLFQLLHPLITSRFIIIILWLLLNGIIQFFILVLQHF